MQQERSVILLTPLARNALDDYRYRYEGRSPFSGAPLVSTPMQENKMIARTPASPTAPPGPADAPRCQFQVGDIFLEIVPHSSDTPADAQIIYATFETEGQRFVVRRIEVPPAVANPLLALLTNRERDIVHRVAAGLRNKQIAYELHLSEYTVAAYVKQICYKLQVRNRTAIVTRCMQLVSRGDDSQHAGSAGPRQLQQVMEGALRPPIATPVR